MASKQKRKIGLPKTDNYIRNTSEFVSVIKHFESKVPVGKFKNCEIPERTFDINKDLNCTTKHHQVTSPRKRIIKFSSASKSMGKPSLGTDSVGATRASLKKRYPSLPQKFNQIQSPSKGSHNFSSKSSRELDMNTIRTSNDFMKSTSESNALLATRSSFTVISDSQVKNTDRHPLNRCSKAKQDIGEAEVEKVPKHSIICPETSKSRSKLEVSEMALESMPKTMKLPDDDHGRGHFAKRDEDGKDERLKNKRRHIAELKTEIAQYRCNKGMSTHENVASATSLDKRDRELVETVPSSSKLNCEDVDIYDSVAFILQNRVIIPNSDEFGSYPLLPRKQIVDNKVGQFEEAIQHTDVSEGEAEAEADISDDDEETSVSGFSAFRQQIGDSLSPTVLSENKVDSETELNSKIEQNKLLISKVQKVLNIIKLGVQFPATSLLDRDYKLETTTSDVIFSEAKSEVETAVHMYEEDIPLRESKSDMNIDVGSISIEDIQEEALRVQDVKSDVETAVRRVPLREITSEDTFKPLSVTDDDMIDEEELTKIMKPNESEDLKDINQNRPLTRRNEDLKWTEDKFRTEPVTPDRYSIDTSDFDLVQAKLDAIHDTESESASDDIYIESTTKEIPTTCKLLDDQTSNTDVYFAENREKALSENTNKANIEVENDYLRENKSDIRKDFPFKSRIIDQDEDKEWTFKKLADDSRKTKNLHEKFKIRKDVASNTEPPVEYKDACTTDDSGRGTDVTCNTDIVKFKEIASNTEQFSKKHVASNTEYKRKDFGSVTKPPQKDFACKADLRKTCRDAISDTDYLKIKTANAECSTDRLTTAPAATQKSRLDGIHMTFESVENIDIPTNDHLKKSKVLQIQVLPTINITSLPTVQKIFHFHIDKHGKSHVSYQPTVKTVAYIEIQSPSYHNKQQSEVKVKTTSTLIDQLDNYESGFREIQKMEPSTIFRHPRQKCKFFMNHKNHPDFENGSETDKMIKASKSKSPYPDFGKIGVRGGDDGEFFIETKSTHRTDILDGTWLYLTKYDTYLKRTCSDSSLVVRTIKEASARKYDSSSTTTSFPIKKQPYDWVVDGLVSDSESNSRTDSVSGSNKISVKNLHSSGNSSQWVGEFLSQNIDEKVYKTYVNPEGFSRRRSRWKCATEKTHTNLECFHKHTSSREDNKSKKSCNTIETQTVPWYPETSSLVSDQATKNNHKSDQNKKIQIQSPEIPTKTLERPTHNETKKIVETVDVATSMENSTLKLAKFLHGNQLDQSETREQNLDFQMETNDNDQWDKISLTVTCTTDATSMKTSPKPATKKSKHSEKHKKDLTESRSTRKTENSSVDEKKNKVAKRKTVERKIKNYVPVEQGDSVLIDKRRKLQRIEKSNPVDDVISKFRNVYMIDTDGTNETSLSEGEIRCNCSTSAGEIHKCKQTFFQKPRPLQRDLGIAPIKKRKNYFDNWTTYYFNKRSLANNSSSTS